MGTSCRLSCSFKMVVKTDLCNYSGFRIYPGHGKKFVRLDQKMFTFINAKAERCFKMKRRNLTTKWTVQYRRINKKGTLEEAEKRRKAKKSAASSRTVSGMSEAMIERKRTARPVQKSKQTEATLKELRAGRVLGRRA